MTVSAAGISSAVFPSGASAFVPRDPPKAIRLLLPIWGRRYIAQFINVGLPTLLAPGNLPALTKSLPCKLVFLTSSHNAAVLREHPACRYLASLCEIEVQIIDDLITGDNYSTTITLAYARAVQAAGPEMVDTCFFFLISDYLIADGSLAHVLGRMRAGINGVLAGNFQVVQQEAIQTFFKRFDRGAAELVLPARDLMRWALRHLHPTTAANTVNFLLSHNLHSNRLFWRVDENTLIGRFYLMHMICIRPEVTNFVIGASCDYSFIPEMCPSDNVEVLTDSDDYLVVEMQPLDHERALLRLGPMETAPLAAGLGEWTTKRHRKNAQSVIVFHAEDIPAALPAFVAESAAFVADVQRRINPIPQPHRHHPYWIGAIAAHNWALRRRSAAASATSADQATREETPASLSSAARYLREGLFGRPPDVRPWHPRWPDYRIILDRLRKLCGSQSRLLVLSPTPAVYADWLSNVTASTTSLESRALLSMAAGEYAALVGRFDGCMLMAGEEEFAFASSLLERIRPLLTRDGFIMVSALNGRGTALGEGFTRALLRHSSKFLDLGTAMTEVNFVRAGMLRVIALALMAWLAAGVLRRPRVYYPLSAILGPFLLAIGLLGTLFAMRPMPSPGRNICSSATMLFRLTGSEAPLPDFTVEDDLYRRADRYRLPALVPEPADAERP